MINDRMDCNSCGRTNIDRLSLCACGAHDHMRRRILDLEDSYGKKLDENTAMRVQHNRVVIERGKAVEENSELKSQLASLETAKEAKK